MQRNTSLPAPTRLVAFKAACAELGIAYTSGRQLVFAGLLPVVKFATSNRPRWYVERRELDALIQRSREVHRA